MTTVLVADPENDRRAGTAATLRDGLPGATLLAADSLAVAREQLAGTTVDVVVTTYDLGDGTGMDLAEAVREEIPDAGVILYSATEDVDTDSFEETIVEYVPRDLPDAGTLLTELVAETDRADTQASYPLPDAERARLEAVTKHAPALAVADALDGLVGLVAAYFDATGVSLALVDEHTQETIAQRGRPPSLTNRDESIGTYTILSEGTLAVEDTTADARFADTEPVRSAGIRAYLGAPLRTAGGHAVGALAVYSDEPRSFSAKERAYLTDAAALAVDLLALDPGGEMA